MEVDFEIDLMIVTVVIIVVVYEKDLLVEVILFPSRCSIYPCQIQKSNNNTGMMPIATDRSRSVIQSP